MKRRSNKPNKEPIIKEQQYVNSARKLELPERNYRNKPKEDELKRGVDNQAIANRRKTTNRRAPRTAAIAIKGIGEDFSYAEALKKARQNISTSDLGIEETRIRKSANGAVIIEIPGKEGNNKADQLRNKLVEVLGKDAVVTRQLEET